jgi:hypothetical protein
MKPILPIHAFPLGETGGRLSRGETLAKERGPLIPVSNGEVLMKKTKEKRDSLKSVCKSVVDELDPALLGDPRPAWPSNSEQMCRPVTAKIERESLAIS